MIRLLINIKQLAHKHTDDDDDVFSLYCEPNTCISRFRGLASQPTLPASAPDKAHAISASRVAAFMAGRQKPQNTPAATAPEEAMEFLPSWCLISCLILVAALVIDTCHRARRSAGTPPKTGGHFHGWAPQPQVTTSQLARRGAGGPSKCNPRTCSDSTNS